MRIAELAAAPVILVGDIDRGGVFASIVGTLQLLPLRRRNLIKGLVINKFRGDLSLLKPGLDFLEKRCRRPVLGVIPYIRNLAIAQEDSVYLDERNPQTRQGYPDVCIIRLPHIANYDDFDPLETLCNIRYAASVEKLGGPDLIILPGTKSTIADVLFLHETGLAARIIEMAGAGTPVFGMCGGYQMLGHKISDPVKAESEIEEAEGLGLLDMETVFGSDKITAQVKAGVAADSGLLAGMKGLDITGYEIHMGRCSKQPPHSVFTVTSTGDTAGSYRDGGINQTGTVFGSYIHGLFNNTEFTRRMINNLCSLRNLRPAQDAALDREKAYDDIAEVFRQSLDMGAIYEIILGGSHGRRIV